MTTAYTNVDGVITAAAGVYVPQQDSQLLIDVMGRTGLALGHRVADLCTGCGVVAIGAAEQGASQVAAFDICPRAVRCARANVLARGVGVEVHLGSWARAVEFGPYELVVCNPPYIPHEFDDDSVHTPAQPSRAVNAGPDGRQVIDPLCVAAPALLVDGGVMLLVQSEFSGIDQTLTAVENTGLGAEVVAQQWIPFGPVLTTRARWLERMGRLEPGRRDERLVVIRVEKK